MRKQHAHIEELSGQLKQEQEQVEEFSASVRKQCADNEQLSGQLKQKQEQVEEFSASVRKQRADNEELSACVDKQHADNEELSGQLKQKQEQLEELSAWGGKQHAHIDELSAWVDKQRAHIEELSGKLKQEQEQVEELSASIRKQHADNEQLSGQLKQKEEQVEELSACIRKQHADNEQLSGQLKQKQEQVEEFSASVRKQRADNEQLSGQLKQEHADNEQLSGQLKQKQEQVEEFSASVRKQRADNEQLSGQLKQKQEQLDELSAWVGKQHAQNEQLSGELKQEQEQVEELSASIRKQHADNEQLSGQLKQKQEQVEEFSASVRKQRADNEQLSGQLKQEHADNEQLSGELKQEHADNEQLSGQLKQKHADNEQLSGQLKQKRADNEQLSGQLKQKHADNEQLSGQLKQEHADNEQLSGQLKQKHADNEQLSWQLKQKHADNEQLSGQLKQKHADNEQLSGQLKQEHADNEQLSGQLKQKHADNEQLSGQLKQKQEQVEEFSASVRKQRADNEQLIAQLKQRQEQLKELSARVGKQHADNEQLISSVAEKKGEVAKLQEQLQGKDRFVLQLEQRHALEKRELEKQLGETSAEVARLDDRIQELANWTTGQNEEIERLHQRHALEKRELEKQLGETSTEVARLDDRIQELANWTTSQNEEIETLHRGNAKLRNLAEFSNRSRQELIELHNARLSVKLRRNLDRLLDFLQSCVPESARAFVRPVYLKFYRLVFSHRYSALLSPQAPASQSGAADSDEAESSETVPKDGTRPAASSAHAPAEVHAYKTSLPFDSYPSYRPKVSVVLPVWNQARLVGESIRSVLEQSYKNLELIVVDDGSTEDLDPVFDKFASDPRVRIIRKTHEGLPKGLNTGFQAVEGEFLTWTSADNVMRPEMIATLLGFLLRNPEVDMTYGNADIINDEGAPLIGSDYRPSNQCPNATQRLRLPHTVETLGLLDDNFIGACFLYRARMGRLVGDYDDALLGTEDYDYWLRVSSHGIIRHVDTEQCLYRYRVHEDTLSAKHGQAQIVHNVQTLMRRHRQRLLYYEKRFDVVIVYDSARGVPQEPVAAIARAFRQLGNAVAVVATSGWESGEPDDQYNVLLMPDPDEVRDWLTENRSASKGILLSFGEDPKWLVALARVWPADSVFCFYWLAPNSDPGRLTVLKDAPGLGTWCLAGSKQVAANLPPHFQRRWSLFIPGRFACSDESKLILKARDNTYVPWDFPEIKSPLVVCIAPLSAKLLDFDFIGEAVEKHPDLDFLFISSSPHYVTHLDTYFPGATNVYDLWYKPLHEWHKYLSRAFLLLAPFSSAKDGLPWIEDTLMCYLTAGKPILATETVQAAGFHDLPNALISSRADSVREALEICPDLQMADQYLKERSPLRRAQTFAAIANNDLLFRGTRDPSGGESMGRETEVAPALSATSERNGQPTVVLETLGLHRGGLERVVAEMASTLNDAGFRSVISTIQEGGDIANACRAAGIRTYLVGRDTEKFQRILDTEKADLLISHYSNFGAASSASRGTPVISVVHNSYIWHSPEQDAEVRATDRAVTRYLAVSKSVRSYFCRKYNIEPSRVVCIPNGANGVFS